VRLSYILPVIITVLTLLHPFVRIYQVHIDPVLQQRHLNTAKAVVLNGLVGSVLWLVLQLLTRAFNGASKGGSTLIVILFSLAFSVAQSLTGTLSPALCFSRSTAADVFLTFFFLCCFLCFMPQV
jgi:hypothetical protein